MKNKYIEQFQNHTQHNRKIIKNKYTAVSKSYSRQKKSNKKIHRAVSKSYSTQKKSNKK